MLTNYKWQISKGDVNIETLIVPQTFEKASVKNENLKIKGHKIKQMEIQLNNRMIGWDNRTKS